MAKFSRKDIFFKDNDMAVFGTDQDSRLYWDDSKNELTLTSTISGVDPTQDYHLSTKNYVDTISGSLQSNLDNKTYTKDDIILREDKVLTDFINLTAAGRVYGMTIVSGTNDGTAAITSGIMAIRESNSSTSNLQCYDISAQDNISLTNNAENFFYIDYNGGSPTLNVDTTRADVNQRDKVGIGRVYREGSHLHILSAGLNADELGKRIQSRFNNVDGSIVRASGLMISETGTRNLAVTAGQVYAGLTPHSIKATDTSSGDTFVYYYRDGGTGWTTTSGNTQIDNQHYDDGSGTLANLNPNRYGVHWVYVDYDGHEYVVYGRGNYTESDALNAQPPSPLPDLINDFSFLVGKIIIQQAASSFYDTESAFTVVLSNAGVSLHNSLSDIQGGTTDEYYHLTSTMYNTLTSNGGVDDASTEHTHDDRYYTESEVDNKFADGVSGWFDDGTNFRVTVVSGLITNIEGSVSGGYSIT